MISPCEVLFKVQIFIDVFLNQLFNRIPDQPERCFQDFGEFPSYQADATDQCRPRGMEQKKGDKNKNMVVQRSETVTICFIIQHASEMDEFWRLQISGLPQARRQRAELVGSSKSKIHHQKSVVFFFMENVLVSQLGFPKNINYLEHLIFATSAGLKIVTFLMVRPKFARLRASHRPVAGSSIFFLQKHCSNVGLETACGYEMCLVRWATKKIGLPFHWILVV